MSENSHEEAHIGLPGYIGVFLVLVVGTILTYLTSQWDLDWIFAGANTLLALLIAFTKMAFVVLFFMHVYWSPKMIRLAIIAAFFCLSLMFAYTMQDYFTRGSGLFTN